MADCQLRQWCGDSRLDVAKSPSFVLNDLERISESHFPDEFEKTDIYHHRTTKTAAESDDTLLNKLTMSPPTSAPFEENSVEQFWWAVWLFLPVFPIWDEPKTSAGIFYSLS